MDVVTEHRKYLDLLSQSFPDEQSLYTEIINLNAILRLPKGTEHFISDLHGEYEAFQQIMNNCSGVIREKVRLVLKDQISEQEFNELCTLIYYPEEKLKLLRSEGKVTHTWYRAVLDQLIAVARQLSSKYTRSKVRKAMPPSYAYILDELLHAQPDEDANQLAYHQGIIDTLIEIGSAKHFITALCKLIKRLAVDRLHVLGDVFDRGGGPDSILEILMQHPSVDFTWGNHDALWMGAAAGNAACVCAVVRNSLAYDHTELLERGYGVSLRTLWMLARQLYPDVSAKDGALRLITLLMFKLEGQLILRHPEYAMEDRLLLGKVDWVRRCVEIDQTSYELADWEFPTMQPAQPYALTPEEQELTDDLLASFVCSERLRRHIGFLYEKGAVYRKVNGNLLFHGCIPMTEDGKMRLVCFDGQAYSGKDLMDYCDSMARAAWNRRNPNAIDFMWYLWCGATSPLCGRKTRTFAHLLTKGAQPLSEPQDPYYHWNRSKQTCQQLLQAFGLNAQEGRIVNGHTPVLLPKGESPIRGEGRLIVIDGGLCKGYQQHTGNAGYTLISNSHGLRVVAHQPFVHPGQAVAENADIVSMDAETLPFARRQMVADTDDGKTIQEKIKALSELLAVYRAGDDSGC